MEETKKNNTEDTHTEANSDQTLHETMAENSQANDEMSTADEKNSLQNELDEWRDKYTRLVAEFDNFKKRTYKEKSELILTGGKEVILAMLEVLDDSERAEKQMESATDLQAVKEGSLLVFNKLRHNLTQKGVKAIECKGMDFDVEKHEAVTEISMPGMEGKVVDELEKGYLLNDKLIRHAKVVVGKLAE